MEFVKYGNLNIAFKMSSSRLNIAICSMKSSMTFILEQGKVGWDQSMSAIHIYKRDGSLPNNQTEILCKDSRIELGGS